MKRLAFFLTLIGFAAGCGDDVREEDAASLLRESRSDLSEVSCDQIEGETFTCDALLNGEPTTFSVVLNESGNFLIGRDRAP